MKLNDYTVPNRTLKVRASLSFDAELLSGQTSGTDSAHKGIRPKLLTITLVIPFDEEAALTELISVAQATSETGALAVYDIVDQTANALKIRQVQFSSSFTVAEADNLASWNIAFSLMEYLSVPEKVEQRIETGEVTSQTTEGVTVAGEGAPPAAATETKTMWETVLSKLDEALK